MNMSGITPPSMDWESTNLPEAWEKFKRHTELIFKGPLKDKAEEEQIAYVLLWIGDKGRDVYQTWKLTADEQKSLKSHFEKFKSYVQPKLNPVFARFRFYNEVQGSDSVDKFVTRLRLRAQDCKFKDMDEMIRDRLVIGTNSSRIREKLINEGDKLTLDKAIQIAQSFEYCQTQMASMNISTNQGASSSSFPTTTPVDAIGRRKGPKHQPHQRQHPQHRRQQQKHQCTNCGKVHGPNKKLDCPAFGKQCQKCDKLNHFAQVCRSNSNQQKRVHDIDSSALQGACAYPDYDEYVDSPEYCIDTVSANSSSQPPDRAFVLIDLGPNKTPVNFKIDTGSECNIISHETFQKLKLSYPLEPPDSKLTSYSGDLIKVIGKVRLPCSYKSNKISASFYVVENSATSLIGLRSSLDLRLIKMTYSVENSRKEPKILTKDSVMSEYKTLFNGIGVIPGFAKLHLKEDSTPVVNPPR